MGELLPVVLVVDLPVDLVLVVADLPVLVGHLFLVENRVVLLLENLGGLLPVDLVVVLHEILQVENLVVLLRENLVVLVLGTLVDHPFLVLLGVGDLLLASSLLELVLLNLGLGLIVQLELQR